MNTSILAQKLSLFFLEVSDAPPLVTQYITPKSAALLIFNGLTEEELRSIPKGHLIVKVAKKCKLL